MKLLIIIHILYKNLKPCPRKNKYICKSLSLHFYFLSAKWGETM
jgi:hypothetical protein